MSAKAELSADGARLTVHLSMKIKRRGGRKIVMAPSGTTPARARPHPDSTLVKAIARAYRWQWLLEEGTYASMRELAAAEKISPTYVSRLLRLTLLSPKLVEATLDGNIRSNVSERWLSSPICSAWDKQECRWPAPGHGLAASFAIYSPTSTTTNS